MKNFEGTNISFFFSESNEQGKYTFESSKFLEIDGRSKYEISELTVRDIRSKNVPQYIFDEMYDWTRNKGFWSGVLENVNKNNTTYWVYATVIKINVHGTTRYGMVSTPASQEQIKKAEHDYHRLRGLVYKSDTGRKALLYPIYIEEAQKKQTFR